LGAASAGAAAAAVFSSSPYSLRNRISAGTPTGELADLTNSPISLNFSRTNLLSTPNSLASSCTRVLATFLLLDDTAPFPADEGWDSDRGWVLQTHREVLIECS